MATEEVHSAVKAGTGPAAERYRAAVEGLDAIKAGVLKPDATWLRWIPFYSSADDAGRREQVKTLDDWLKQLGERWAAAKTDAERNQVATLAEQWLASAQDVLGVHGEKHLTFRQELKRDLPPVPHVLPTGRDALWLAGLAALGVGVAVAFSGRRR